MIFNLLVWCLIVSGLALSYFLIRRVIVLRRGDETFHLEEPSIHVFVKPTIDYSAFRLVTLVKHLMHQASLHLLTLIARGLSFAKYIVVKLENRFGKVINSVRGRGEMGKRGSASVYLREIEEHKQSLRLSRETN